MDVGVRQDDLAQVQLRQMGTISVRARVAMAAVAILVVLAFLKPWDADKGPSTGAQPLASATGTAAAAATEPDSSGSSTPTAGRMVLSCQASGWRAAGISRTSVDETRRWWGVSPVTALGPSDPLIPTVRLVADQLVGIGYCAPDELPYAGVPTIYRLATPSPVIVASPATLSPVPSAALPDVNYFLPPVKRLQTVSVHQAEVFLPPDGHAVWPVGRYILRIPVASSTQSGPPGSGILWFAIQVVASTPSG